MKPVEPLSNRCASLSGPGRAPEPSATEEAPSGEPPSTLERLLTEAGGLFAERGYTGASMADIAGRVGIRKPSLYNYFSSKEELFMELLERSLEAWKAASDLCDETEGSFCLRLRRHLQATIDFALASPDAMALCRLAVSQVSGELEERAGALLLAQRQRYRQTVESFFDDAVAAGEVIDLPREILAASWLTFLDGMLTHLVFSLGDQGAFFVGQMEAIWNLFWRGLELHPGDLPDGTRSFGEAGS